MAEGEGGPPVPRAAWPVVCEPKLPRAGAVQQPGLQHAVLDQGAPRVGDAFAVERLGAQAAHAMRIVDDRDAGREHFLAHPVLQETHAARDGGAGNRAREMTQQAVGHARFKHDRHAWDGTLRGLRRATARSPALLPTFSAASRSPRMPRAGTVVIGLHVGAFAGQHGDADAMTGAGIAAEEAGAGRERNRTAAEVRAAAFGIGDARHRQRGAFCRAGALDQRVGGRLGGVFKVERGNALREAIRRRETGEFVLRRQLRHRHGAAGQGIERVRREIGRGDECHALADKHPQAQIGGFGPFDIFKLAQAVGHAGGNAFHQ